MTVSTTVRKVTVTGDGVTTSFSFSPMKVFANSDLVVTKRSTAGVELLLTEGSGATNYTVVPTGTDVPFTGSITYPSSGSGVLASGEKLIITPRLPLTQETDLENQGGYFAETQEDQFDRLVMIAQQHQEQLDRSPRMTVGHQFSSLEIAGVPTAGQVLAVNNSVNGLLWSSTFPTAITVGSFWQSIIDDADLAASLVSLGFSSDMQSFLQTANDAAARTALGSGTVGDAIFLTTTKAAARTAAGLDGFMPVNLFINGNCNVAQLPVLSQAAANSLGWTLGSTAKWSKCDGWAAYSTAGTITAGSATQDTASTVGALATAVHLSGITMTGSAKIAIAQRIPGDEAKRAKNGAYIVGATFLHDIGSSKNITITVNKPTALDNYGAVAQIAQSGALSVPNATNTTVSLAISNMGDCSNGIEVIFELDCGAMTTKNVRMADAFLVAGTAVPDVTPIEFFQQALARCQRQFAKTFSYGMAPAQNTGSIVNAILSKVPAASGAAQAVWQFPQVMRASPTLTTFSPGDATANWWNFSVGGNTANASSGLGDARVHLTTATGLTVGEIWGIHATAYAGLY